MTEEIKFAFAVSDSNNFKTSHFGDADKYLIYKWKNNEIKLSVEIINIEVSR